MDRGNEYMLRALKLAFGRMGKTSPNPPVGCVIAKNGAVVSTGGTEPYGARHAEIVAISGAHVDLSGADMYVSLEPCNHYGKTPPCTSAIIKSGISRVFIPMLDPNPLVSGRGVAELRRSGVEVIFMDEMADYAVDLLRNFKKYIRQRRPFVLNKCATTLDGRIAAKTGDSRWISSEQARLLSHRLRAKADAVIVGLNTFVRDNPSLAVRLDSFSDGASNYFRSALPAACGRDNFFLTSLFTEEPVEVRAPLRVVIGLPPDIVMSSAVFADGNYLFFEKRSAVDRIVGNDRGMAKKLGNMRLVSIDTDSPVDEAGLVCDELYRMGIMFAMIEGGGRLAGSFFDAGEIDQFFYVIAPKVVGGGIPCLDARGADLIVDSMRLHDVTIMPVGDDFIYNGYKEPGHVDGDGGKPDVYRNY
jgi:diaminohydroxyphosphoribosylaminopyrimidine deaminase/5-amino-6-(5-phosphoribosylamino)uracil reductase